MNRKTQRLLPLLALPLVAVAACGGGDDSSSDATTTAAQAPVTTTIPATTTPAATPASTPDVTPLGIRSYGDVQPAVVQIVARGTFRDPEIGFADGSGLGSGFLISDDGLVVTNNHVVAGAATLEVYVGGELDTSYNAQVLGVSECNDLAVIKLTTSDEMPYLDVVRRRHRGRPRRLRRRLPARRPGVHADQGHRRQGPGRWRSHGHVVDRPHRRARRQHPARQLGRPARQRRGPGRRRQLRRRRQRHDDRAVLRHRLRPRPAGRRAAGAAATSSRSASTAGPSPTTRPASPASGSPASAPVRPPPMPASSRATSSRP